MSLRRSVLGSIRGSTQAVQVRHRTDTGSSSRLPPSPLLTRPTNSYQDEDRPPVPLLEQSVDLFCLGDITIDEADTFGRSISQDASISRDHWLFELPLAVRHQIYGHCYPPDTRKVILSPGFATKAAFPPGYFADPWEVLANVCGGLESFRALRHELLTYFWTHYHFHATLTPFNGPRFSPLSHIWLRDNLAVVQKLTVEVDFTRFGGSILKIAPKHGYHMETPLIMLIDLIKGLLSRRGDTLMAELHLMCRQYAGLRPLVSEGSPDTAAGQVGRSAPYLNLQYAKVSRFSKPPVLPRVCIFPL